MVRDLLREAKRVLIRTPALSVYLWCLRMPIYQRYQHRRYIRKYARSGQIVELHDLKKQQIVIDYARRSNLHVFVETGTHRGIMIEAVKNIFDEIYSIELDKTFYEYSQNRFASENHITIINGDSGEILGEVLAPITRPCLFWLDAHCSGFAISTRGKLETAIRGELRSIFGHPIAAQHVILVDDARCFTGKHDYPSINNLRAMSREAGFDSFEVKDDVIRICKAARQ